MDAAKLARSLIGWIALLVEGLIFWPWLKCLVLAGCRVVLFRSLQWHGLCLSLAVHNSYAMEATTITPELLRQLTDDRHLRVVREPVGEHTSEEADREREIDTLRDVMYRLWNAEHQRRA